MSRIKPIIVMNEESIASADKDACISGICELLNIVGVNSKIKIIDRAVWRDKGYKDGDNLKEYGSVDWYLYKGLEDSRNGKQINAGTILDYMTLNLIKNNSNHYFTFLLDSDIYNADNNFVIGLARSGIGTVISTHRFQNLEKKLKIECIKTETIHELGHVFGLLSSERTENVEHSLGKHCTNVCVMRQGLYVPDDWIKITEDRLKFGPLCQLCQEDIKKYFFP